MSLWPSSCLAIAPYSSHPTPPCCVNRMHGSSSVVWEGPTGPMCDSRDKQSTLWACTAPLFYPVPWPILVGRVATPYRCLPANRLLNESFVSNDSCPRPNMEQQSQSGGKPGVLRLRCPWLTAAVSSGLASLDLRYRDARDSCITQPEPDSLVLFSPAADTKVT